MRACLRGLSCLVVALLTVPLLAGAGDDKEPAKKDTKEVKKTAKDVKKDAKKDAKKDLKKEDDKKSGKKDGKKEEEPKTEKLVWGGEVVGKLTQLEGKSQRDLTIHVSYKVKEPNIQGRLDYQRTQMEWARRQGEIQRNPNLQERINQMQQLRLEMARHQPNLWTSKDVNYDVQVRTPEDIKVRTFYPPLEYDDKGNVKKWTPKELQELRKDGLPGFPSEFENLRTGQTVKVYLKRKAPPLPLPKGGKGQEGKKTEGKGPEGKGSAGKDTAGKKLKINLDDDPDPGKGDRKPKEGKKQEGKGPAGKGAKIKLDDDPDLGQVGRRPEAVMIMILQENIPQP